MNVSQNSFNQNRKPSVCYKCAERAEGCHGYCEKYKAERAENDEVIKKRVQVYQGAGYAMDEHRKHLKRLHRITRGRMK